MVVARGQRHLARQACGQDSAGFTILELLIAASVFSTILLLSTYGLIQVGRVYMKGVTTVRTQEVARTVMNEITQAIQFSGQAPLTLTQQGNALGYCVGSRRYSYLLGVRQADTPGGRALVADDTTCGAGTLPLAINHWGALPSGVVNPRVLLPSDMRLLKLDITPAGDGLYSVTVRVAAGDYDLLQPRPDSRAHAASHDAICGHDVVGGQFCAVTEINSVVKRRTE